MAVLKSANNQYFLKILFNTYLSKDVMQFRMYNYLSGNMIKQYNLHALFVIPSKNNYWDKFYVIDCKEILEKTPLFINFNTKLCKFYDNNGNTYPHYTLEDALNSLSDQSGNMDERSAFNWSEKRKSLVSKTPLKLIKFQKSEFSVFIDNFLFWKKTFTVQGKSVISVAESSSGGPDVRLYFQDGTIQELELEHKWKNYVLHEHYKSRAWQGVWLYADEDWDFDTVKAVFSPYIKEHLDSIPKVFLCADKVDNVKKAYEVNWHSLTFSEIDISE